MKYRLTFTVIDKSEEARYINEQFPDNLNIQLDYIVRRGCDLEKTLDQNPNYKKTYVLYSAEFLED